MNSASIMKNTTKDCIYDSKRNKVQHRGPCHLLVSLETICWVILLQIRSRGESGSIWDSRGTWRAANEINGERARKRGAEWEVKARELTHSAQDVI